MPEKKPPIAVESVFGHEGPTLLDFYRDFPQFDIGINGPKLLFNSLELRTSLHLQDGCDYAALRKLADGFIVTAHCGHSPATEVTISVMGGTLAPYISIDVGPPSMYMSQLIFETKKKETFAQLCDRTLNLQGRKGYLVALVPILNEESGNGGHHSHGHEHDSMLAESLSDTKEIPQLKCRIEQVLLGQRSKK